MKKLTPILALMILTTAWKSFAQLPNTPSGAIPTDAEGLESLSLERAQAQALERLNALSDEVVVDENAEEKSIEETIRFDTHYPASGKDRDLVTQTLSKYIQEGCNSGLKRLEEFVKSGTFSVAPKDSARALRAENIASEIARLETAHYDGLRSYLGMKLYHSPECRDAVMDIVEQLSSRIPEPKTLDMDELYNEQMRNDVLKWGMRVYMTATVLQMFAHTPKGTIYTPRSQAQGFRNLMAWLTRVPDSLSRKLDTLESLLIPLPGQRGAFQIAGETLKAFRPWRVLPTLEDMSTFMRNRWSNIQSVGSLIKEAPENVVAWFGARGKSLGRAVLDPKNALKRGATKTKEILVAGGKKSWEVAGKVVNRKTAKAAGAFTVNMVMSHAVAAAGYGAARMWGYGEIERPKVPPEDWIVHFQAWAILDLENKALDLVERLQVKSVQFDQMFYAPGASDKTREAILALFRETLNSLESEQRMLRAQWQHFSTRAPLFNHTISDYERDTLHDQDEINLADTMDSLATAETSIAALRNQANEAEVPLLMQRPIPTGPKKKAIRIKAP